MTETLEDHVGTVESVAHGGSGIIRVEGRVCFVPDALPGDVVRLRSVHKRRGVFWADRAELLEASEHRQDAPCPHFGVCGGCSWLHFAYPAQAEWKRRIVQDSLRRIGGIDARPEWLEAPELRLGYRTRARFQGDRGQWGFFQRGSHDVVDVGACPLCHPRLNAVLDRLRGLSFRGWVEATVNPEGDEALVWAPKNLGTVQAVFPEAEGDRRLLERKQFLLDGVPVVNGAFSQSSLLLNRLLAKTVRELMGDPASVLDLYCGSGNFSLALDSKARVHGLDHNAAAVAAAEFMRPGSYEVGDEAAFKRALAQGPWDVVVLDPPRTGARALLNALTPKAAGAVVYVSCDPATLARDLKAMCGHGWKVDAVAAVDMFPNTPHVETVVRLAQ